MMLWKTELWYKSASVSFVAYIESESEDSESDIDEHSIDSNTTFLNYFILIFIL